MTVELKLKHVLFLTFLTVLFPPIGYAGTYMGLAVSPMNIRTDTGSTSPLMANISLGYAKDAHKLELAIMSSIKDDNLNQLVTDITFASSLLYRYAVKLKNTLHLNLILGYSQLDIESSYVNVPAFTETFQGVSFGAGLEEALKSIPQLKFKIDFIQLYRGDQLTVNSFNVGFRYEF
jgi:hypothetical protein